MKLFCIGLSKTGTRSLTKALGRLGYNIVHYPTDAKTLECLKTGDYTFSHLDCDGVSDITVSHCFRELLRVHRNAKFIYTTRELTPWLDSCEKHWSSHPYENLVHELNEQGRVKYEIVRTLRYLNYGRLTFDRHNHQIKFMEHQLEVVKCKKLTLYGDRILTLPLEEPDKYKLLCDFLNLPLLEEEYPHVK